MRSVMTSCIPSSSKSRVIELGSRFLRFPDELKPLIESTDAYRRNDFDRLRSDFSNQGYLFIRGLIPRDHIMTARTSILQSFEYAGGILDPLFKKEDGVLLSRCGSGCVPFLEGKNAITHDPTVANVLESDNLKLFFNSFFRKESLTFDFKWLRAIGPDQFTGIHYDNVYMSRGSSNLMTTWIPFGDTPIEMGTVCVWDGSVACPGRIKQLRQTYGKIDHEAIGLEGSGWFSEDPLEIQGLASEDPAISITDSPYCWRTADFEAGDCLMFGMHTLHMSSKNKSNRLRISCDTRWQPREDRVDTRYVGDVDVKQRVQAGISKAAVDNTIANSPNIVTMLELKKKWGFI